MSRSLGVALLPQRADMERAILIQQQLSLGSILRPILGMKANLPHISFIQGPLREDFEPIDALATIRESSAVLHDLHIPSVGVEYKTRGWLFLTLQRIDSLKLLQESVIKAITPYIDLNSVDWGRDVSQYSADEKESYKKYGYRYIGEAFLPHITLGRVEEATGKELAEKAAVAKIGCGVWVFDRLSFYVLGENGAHSRLLAELPLQLS